MKIKCGFCQKVGEAIEKATYARYECKFCNNINEVTNVDLKSWLGFQYTSFLQSIESFITHDQFEQLKANSDLELEAGKFSEQDINKLKSILIISFKEGYSIRDIRNKIANEIKPKDLLKIDNDAVTDTVLVPSGQRSIMIARTESTRVASEGALLNYKNNGIEQCSWLAATGERTCNDCAALNGTIMSITEAQGQIPKHPYCRCTYIPIVKSSVTKNVMVVSKLKEDKNE